ncbi:NADPH-dependent F420 reductase [Paraburkholderia sp. SIMBA_030]|uniref:NADPH-dependent F420 reductase n=1 Tax=Paraburkholderia sp. SIMBA_030 TaxID=3085773 RepID=UPI00397B44DD
MNTPLKIGIIGGTGALGSGLAARWAKAGRYVVIGSRRIESAQATCESIVAGAIEGRDNEAPRVSYGLNVDVARDADVIVVTVPFDQQEKTLASIREFVQGKIVIDTTVPLLPPKVGTVNVPESGAAAVSAKCILGEDVKVFSAFHNVAADKLQSLEELDCDVLVFGDDKDDRPVVISLVEDAGMRGFYGGGLRNSIAAEALTSVLITINRQLKCQTGIRLVGMH